MQAPAQEWSWEEGGQGSHSTFHLPFILSVQRREGGGRKRASLHFSHTLNLQHTLHSIWVALLLSGLGRRDLRLEEQCQGW